MSGTHTHTQMHKVCTVIALTKKLISEDEEKSLPKINYKGIQRLRLWVNC